MAATDVQEAAKDGLVSVGSLKRAKRMLRVCSRRQSVKIAVPQSKNGETITVIRWMWQLPDDEELLRPYRERLLREQAEDAEITGDNEPPASPA